MRTLPSKSMNIQLTSKPARFDYKELDKSIEQRAAFGLPTKGMFAKLVSATSIGLLAEAAYNKLGLFPYSNLRNLWGQLHIPDAYEFTPDNSESLLTPRIKYIEQQINTAHESLNIRDHLPTKTKSIYIPGIHLHNTINSEELNKLRFPNGLNFVDSSILSNIGSAHPSFRIMLAAYVSAKQSN